jgi:ubiquinone/menaquinone biosynthesis C-methylase UbiE
MKLTELVKLGLDREINEFIDFPEGLILNIGAGNKNIDGSIIIDFPEYDADKDILPFENNSISGIHCYHFLEHVKYPAKVLADFQRVLVVGGVVNIVVPYYNSQMAHQDLDHKNFFCEETWRVLFSNPYYDKNKINWSLAVHTNFIFGIVERNLSLFTQLEKK